MTTSQRLRVATISVFCTLLVAPATALASPNERVAAQTGTADETGQTAPTGSTVPTGSTAPTDSTVPTDSTGPTGATEPTGSTDPTSSAGGDNGGLVSTTPDNPAAAPESGTPANPGTETPGAPVQNPAPAPAPQPGGDISQPRNDSSGSGSAGRRDQRTPAAAVTAPSPPAVSTVGRKGTGGATDKARKALLNTGLLGVQADFVITKLVERIPPWMRWALAALSLAAVVLTVFLVRERRRRRIAEQDAMVDALTGISNRKAFERRLDLEWRRASRYGRELGLMIVDLDGFKLVNDNHGHSAGDRLLREIAGRLHGRMRDTDLVARIGGDEFAVICPETGLDDLAFLSAELADRATAGLSNPVGVSIGVAEFQPSDSAATAMLDRADASMYRVKRGEGSYK